MLSVYSYKGASVRRSVENILRLRESTTGTSKSGIRDGCNSPLSNYGKCSTNAPRETEMSYLRRLGAIARKWHLRNIATSLEGKVLGRKETCPRVSKPGRDAIPPFRSEARQPARQRVPAPRRGPWREGKGEPRAYRLGRARRPPRAGSGRHPWRGRRCRHSGSGRSGCSSSQRCRPGRLGGEREGKLSRLPQTHAQPAARARRAFSPAALRHHSLWLQRMPVQPAGHSQPVSSASHVAPFWQSSQVRLQSGPNVCSRQTATRSAAGEEPSPRLPRPLGEFGQSTHPPTHTACRLRQS